MAAASINIVKEDYLSCVICSEIFKHPKTLHCNHSFCRSCLTRFMQNAEGVAKARGIPCPYCRQTTPVPDPNRPVSEWVEQIRDNFYIIGLIEALNPQEIDCSLCESEGKNTKATLWCDQCDSGFCNTCLKVHSKMPMLKSHDVIKISSMSLQSVQTRQQEFCKDHRNEHLKCFCETCDVLVCNSCISIKHPKCKNFINVPEMGKTKRFQLKKQHDILISELKKTRETLTQIKEIKADFYERQKKVEKSIKETASRIVAEIREKETVLLEELAEISEREIKRFEENIKTVENISKVTLQNIQLIEQLMTSGSDCDVISQHKDVSEKTSPGNVHDMSVGQINLEFTSNLSDIQDQLSKLILGKLFVNKHLGLETPFNTRMMEDEREPDLTDIIVLTMKDMRVTVVTDWKNKCVKCFYINHDKTCSSRVDVGGQPWNVTKLSHDMIAVSIWSHNKICLISVTPDLRWHSAFSTKTSYRGLAAISQDTLAAGSPVTHSVDLIDLKGRILRSVTTDMFGHKLFSHPQYLCISPAGDIIVSDWDKKAVTCVTLKGDVRFRYQPGKSWLDCPLGVSCDQSGDVFVLDKDLHKVTKITGDGKFSKNILKSQDGLTSAWSVCYHGNDLYVVHGGEIRIFRLN